MTQLHRFTTETIGHCHAQEINGKLNENANYQCIHVICDKTNKTIKPFNSTKDIIIS